MAGLSGERERQPTSLLRVTARKIRHNFKQQFERGLHFRRSWGRWDRRELVMAGKEQPAPRIVARRIEYRSVLPLSGPPGLLPFMLSGNESGNSQRSKLLILATDVDIWPHLGIFLSLSQYLTRYRCRVTFAKEDT